MLLVCQNDNQNMSAKLLIGLEMLGNTQDKLYKSQMCKKETYSVVCVCVCVCGSTVCKIRCNA